MNIRLPNLSEDSVLEYVCAAGTINILQLSNIYCDAKSTPLNMTSYRANSRLSKTLVFYNGAKMYKISVTRVPFCNG